MGEALSIQVSIDEVIKVENGVLYKYQLTKYSPQEVLQQYTFNSRWYLKVKNITKNKYFYLDLLLIMTETKLNSAETWDDFTDQLTDRIVQAYSTTITSNSQKVVTCTHLFNSDDFELSYCNLETPKDRNIKTQLWKMNDLVITKVNPKNTINLKNCICSINGIVSLPMYMDEELYIKDGALHMSTVTELNTPSAALLNFDYIGNITIVPFKDCEIQYYTPRNTPAYNCNMKFFLPEDLQLTHKTVFTVLAHSLFFPRDVVVSSDKSIVLTPSNFPIGTSLLKLYQHNSYNIHETDIIQLNMSIEEYILTGMFKDDWYGNFFIIVDNPEVFIEKTKLDHHSDSVYTSKENDGFLFDRTTQSIYDYVKVDYTSANDFYKNRFGKNYMLDLPHFKKEYGMLTWDCVHHDELFNIHNPDLYIMKIRGK